MLRFRESLKKRYLLTGESPRQLLHKRVGEQFRAHALIPSAVGDQALLEAWTMSQLQRAELGEETFPLGVCRIRVPEHGAPVIHLDDRPMISHEIALRVCEALLPVSGPDGPMEHGVAGLRVLSVSGQDLTVGLMGSSAALTIRAADSWRHVLSLRQRQLETDGYSPRWDPACPLEYEDEIVDIYGACAPLGSALLRRLAIFHSLDTPFIVDGWINPDTWILELTTDHVSTYSPDLAIRHDKFLALLCDEHLGLPLRIDIDTSYCICQRPFGYGAACAYTLVPRYGRSRQKLQIRFRWIPGQPNYAEVLHRARRNRG
ncbi:hypothetical protein [Mycobacteroides abscessus]|uniref:hypothetical protein n=1 Tax=Mycobacteroides abscessus TaxID=36809 RepID=UPI001056A9B8|nr:hypothetical protein [Mycobacteroides abscessus]